MSLLRFRTGPRPKQSGDQTDVAFAGTSSSPASMGLLGLCANPGCSSGWLHLFRKHSRPMFEGGWTCSPECTEARIQSAVRRELEGGTSSQRVHRHRIPLGLLMLEKGWITQPQLRKALEAQRGRRGTGRLWKWLVRQGAVSEEMVTRALGMQWSCPVLSIDSRAPLPPTTIMPRLFLEVCGALPLRVAREKILYLGFEESLDPALALAVEKMTGLRVESGIVPSSVFRPALAGLLTYKFPSVQLMEAVSASAAAHMLARVVERTEPMDSRLVRLHDFLWMRMFLSTSWRGGSQATEAVIDVVCTVGLPQVEESRITSDE